MQRLRASVLLAFLVTGTFLSPAIADIPRLSTESNAIRVCNSAVEMECLEKFDVIYPNGKVSPVSLLAAPTGSYLDANGQIVENNVSSWSFLDVLGSARKIAMIAYILPEKHVNPAYKRYTPTMWIGLDGLTREDISSNLKFKIAVRSSWLTPQGAGMYGANAELIDEKISGGRRYTFIGSPTLSASIVDPAAWANLDTAKSIFEKPTFYFVLDHWSSLPGGSFYNDACAEYGYHFGSSNAIVGGEPYMSDLETLKFNIGSAHLLSTGEINTGFFTTTYPVKYLDCRWPGNTLTKSPRVEVSVVNSDGTAQVATTSVRIQNGIFQINVFGFHYSQPTIVLKATTDTNVPLVNVSDSVKPKPAIKKTITCVKGKVIKKVVAFNPVCPKGYKKR